MSDDNAAYLDETVDIDEARPSTRFQHGQYISDANITLAPHEATTYVDSSVKISSQDVAASSSALRMLTRPYHRAKVSTGIGKQRAKTAQQFIDDSTLYKPIGAIYAKKCIPIDICTKASKLLQTAATTANRRILSNGGYEPPQTGIIGYYDYASHPTQHKCRETEFTRANWPMFANECSELIKHLNKVYARFAPRHHQLQMETIPEAYKLFGTCFSTLTVNRNFRTAAHVDRGDFKSGLGIVAVLEGHGFSGCYLAIPKLNLAFDLKPGDALLFDTGFLHGNTEVYIQVTEKELAEILNSVGLVEGNNSAVGQKRSRNDDSACFSPNIVRKRGNRTFIEVPFGSSGDPLDPATKLALVLAPKWQRISIVAYLRSGLATPLCWQNRLGRNLQVEKFLNKTKNQKDAIVNLAKGSTDTDLGFDMFVPYKVADQLTRPQTEALMFAASRLAYPKQEARPTTSFVRSVSGCILALPMGQGKTLTGLLSAFNHFHQFPAEDVIVISPKSVLTHWKSEVAKWAADGLVLPMVVAATDEVSYENGILMYNQHVYQCEVDSSTSRVGHLFIVNFESVRSLRTRCPTLAPGLILVDEGHRIGTYSGSASLAQYHLRGKDAQDSNSDEEEGPSTVQHTQCLPALCDMTSTPSGGQRRRVIIFTGTPLQNNTQELYRLVEFICPAISLTLPPAAYQQKIAALDAFLDFATQRLTTAKRDADHEDLLFREAVVAQKFIIEWARGFMYRAPQPSQFDSSTPTSTYSTRDLIIVCNVSPRQQRYIDRDNLYKSAEMILSANEHRPAHLTAHPLCLLTFLATGQRVLSSRDEEHHQEDQEYLSTVLNTLQRGPKFTSQKSTPMALPESAETICKLINTPSTSTLFNKVLLDSGKLLATVSIICRVAIHLQEKVVVFTQYAAVQRLIWEVMAALGVKCAAVCGSDKSESRDASIDVFRNSPPQSPHACNVLLITSKTGSYGLDLTCANHLIIFDSWWNPQIDAQAAARINRKHQVRDVTIYRIASTHEEEIVLKLHSKKLLLFDLIINSAQGEDHRQHIRISESTTKPTPVAENKAEIFTSQDEATFWKYLTQLPLANLVGSPSDRPAVAVVKWYHKTKLQL